MTVPSERRSAVLRTGEFLFALCNRHCWEDTYPNIPWPRVPKRVSEMAKSLHRHYPMAYEMEKASEKLPELFGKGWRPDGLEEKK